MRFEKLGTVREASLSRGQNMRTRTIRLAILPFQGFLVYLFSANTLSQTGVVNLPLSYRTIGAQGFAIQMTLLTLQLLVILVSSVLVKTQRLGSASLPSNKLSKGLAANALWFSLVFPVVFALPDTSQRRGVRQSHS
jgi:hypothetical protein